MDPLKDDWHKTGGIPKSVAIHGRYDTGGDPASVARQVAVDADGKILLGDASSIEVTVTNDADNPVPTNETPFESFTVSSYAVPVDPLSEGSIAWQGADDIECKGMLVFTPPDNVGEIYIGDSPTTCFTPFYPGTRATYPLSNLRALYAYAVSGDSQPQTLIVERYF